jgi:molybdate transport system permease protein
MDYDFIPFLLSLKLASVTTIILLITGIPIAHWLAFTSSKLKPFIHTLVALPLVLPPSVIGFYFLLLFSPANSVGKFLEDNFNLRLVFSFEGLIIGSVFFGIPFMINPIASSFENCPRSLIEAAYTLGKSKWETIQKVIIPFSKTAIFSATIMTFAHTLGEFGLVLMIGGSIPDKTKLASIAIYQEVEMLHYESAHFQSILILIFSFLLLFSFQITQYKPRKKF